MNPPLFGVGQLVPLADQKPAVPQLPFPGENLLDEQRQKAQVSTLEKAVIGGLLIIAVESGFLPGLKGVVAKKAGGLLVKGAAGLGVLDEALKPGNLSPSGHVVLPPNIDGVIGAVDPPSGAPGVGPGTPIPVGRGGASLGSVITGARVTRFVSPDQVPLMTPQLLDKLLKQLSAAKNLDANSAAILKAVNSAIFDDKPPGVVFGAEGGGKGISDQDIIDQVYTAGDGSLVGALKPWAGDP